MDAVAFCLLNNMGNSDRILLESYSIEPPRMGLLDMNKLTSLRF